MRVKQLNDEVLFTTDSIVHIGRRDISELKERAIQNPFRRIRLCAHKDVDDEIHEMLIVHTRDTYVRPHKHIGKSESLHVIEGSADMVTLDETGNLSTVTRLGEYSSEYSFYHRTLDPSYHTLLIYSDFLIFHESTRGPFRPSDTTWAPWAPDQKDMEAAKEYIVELETAVTRFGSIYC